MAHRVVYFDLETAGLDPSHAVIQLAAVATEDFVEVDSFEAKIMFDVAAADPVALDMNSYEAEVWRKEAQPERTVVEKFGRFLSQHATIEKVSKRSGRPYRVAWLAGHNIANFDVPRLSAMFKRHDRFLAAEIYRPLDTLQLAWWCGAGAAISTEAYTQVVLCEAFGIDTGDAHDALADVRMCVKVSRALHQRLALERA